MNTEKAARTALTLLAAAALLAAVACTEAKPKFVVGGPGSWVPGDGPVVGSGQAAEENRPISGVNGIILDAVGSIYVQQGGAPSLRVRADDNVLQHIRTDMIGGNLVFQFAHGVSFNNSIPIELHVTVSDLRHVELSGVGNIVLSGLNGNRLTVVHDGVGNLELIGASLSELDVQKWGTGSISASGNAQRQTLLIDGVGDYDGGGFATVETEVTIRSRANATVRVSDRLSVSILGAGSVFYYGDPVVERTGNGSGRVQRGS